MRAIRNLAATLAIGLAPVAQAANFSDLWWNPAESGWGANIVQQLETAFVTVFHYGPTGEPTWLVASDAQVYAYDNRGLPHFRGTLYRTRGPHFSGPFNPGNVQVSPVGQLYVEPLGDNSIRLTYTVDGVEVVKTLARQTWEIPINAANYVGTFSLRVSFPGGAPIGTSEYNADFLLHVDTQTNQATMRVEQAGTPGRRCDYSGPYSQSGRYGAFAGEFTCSTGESGTFQATRLEFTDAGLTGNLRITRADGIENGRFGATRR